MEGGLINEGGVMPSTVNALYGLGQVLISLLCTMNITIASQTKWCKKVSRNTMLKRHLCCFSVMHVYSLIPRLVYGWGTHESGNKASMCNEIQQV